MDDHVNFSAEYAGALKVQLVNRSAILDEIRQAIQDRPHPLVFYITGLGGMGKTYLVREVLARLREGGEWHEPGILPTIDEVDLYHPDTHSPEGLMRAIHAVLKPEREYFGDYLKSRDTLEHYRQELERARDVAQQRELVSEAFIRDFARLTGDFRPVLVLDTAEVLLYESDEIQDLLGLEEASIEARGWLIGKFLPAIGNAVVLIAGRPEPPALVQELRKALGKRLCEISIGPLDEPDTMAYLDAVAKAAVEANRPRVAELTRNLDIDTRRLIHLYTEGRPILLSLMIDYLTVADRLLPAVRATLMEAKSLTAEGLQQARQSVEADIVRAILEANRPADEAILALAWARRGVNAGLLAKLIGVDEGQAKALLEELAELSFVKIRRKLRLSGDNSDNESDDDFFLQDEMYGLLQRYALDNLLPIQRRRALTVLETHGAEEVRKARAKYQSVQDTYFSGSARPLAMELAEARLALRRAIADHVYYCLQLDPIRGFEAYYRYAEEAFQSSDESLDLEIRDELLRYLQKARAEDHEKIEARATWDAGLRWVKRLIVKGDYPRAQEIAARLRHECARIMQAAGPLAETELDIWEGWLFAYRGQNLERAETRLRAALELLKGFIHQEETFEAWYRQILLANALNNLGYLLRVRGRYRQAIKYYTAALPEWRALKNETEHANTLNNLAWALAEVGEFDQALRYVQDGLDLRQNLGPRYPIALSLNTLGLIQVRNDQPNRAVENCERALTIFRDLEQRRGVGLACTALAEANRRMTRAPGLRKPLHNVDLLRKAERHARDARGIFSDDVAETPRLIDALIELGCVYREWARLQPSDQPTEDGSPEGLAERGQDVLRQAAQKAHGLLVHKEVDALVNLTWLCYYVNDFDGARQIIEQQVYELVKEYRTLENPQLLQPADPNAFIWVQLGKSHLLLGQIAFDQYHALDQERKRTGGEVETSEDFLRRAAWHYTFSLAYDELFAKDFRDLRAGLDAIYRNLKKLNPRELQSVYQAVKQTAQNFDLDQRGPSRMQIFLEKSFGIRNGDEQVLS